MIQCTCLCRGLYCIGLSKEFAFVAMKPCQIGITLGRHIAQPPVSPVAATELPAHTTNMGDRGGFGRGFGRGGERGDRGDRRGRPSRRPRGRKDEEEKWVPVTKLGRLVQQVLCV